MFALFFRYLNSVVWVLPLFFIHTAAQANLSPSPLIINGENAAANEYPFHARLVYKYSSSQGIDTCGATLLTNYFVLTAAHCLVKEDNTPYSPSNFGIIVRDFSVKNKYEADEIKAIRSFHIHPNYQGNKNKDNYLTNDIAIIELAQPLLDEVEFMPLDTLTQNQEYDMISEVTIIGLGYTSDTQKTPSVLQQATVNLLSQQACQQHLLQNTATTNYPYLCIDTQLSNVCNGDSGGSLLYKTAQDQWQQIGLTSFGLVNSCENSPVSVFTKMSFHRDWINERLEAGPSHHLTLDSSSSGGSITYFHLILLSLGVLWRLISLTHGALFHFRH